MHFFMSVFEQGFSQNPYKGLLPCVQHTYTLYWGIWFLFCKTIIYLHNTFVWTMYAQTQPHVAHGLTKSMMWQLKTWGRDRQEEERDRGRLSWLEKTHPHSPPLCKQNRPVCMCLSSNIFTVQIVECSGQKTKHYTFFLTDFQFYLNEADSQSDS